ncbi:MAG: META domain-containing protein [Casimicrobiaceae bacterium]
MRLMFPLTFSLALAACAATGAGGPVLPGLVNAPPPPIAAEDSLPIGVVWSWQMTQMSDGALVVPEGRDRYTLEFRPGGTVSVRADCNRGSATYVRSGNTLGIGPIALTKIACPSDSRDAEFLKGLGAVSGHLIRGNDLVLTLKVDSGAMQFTPSRP